MPVVSLFLPVGGELVFVTSMCAASVGATNGPDSEPWLFTIPVGIGVGRLVFAKCLAQVTHRWVFIPSSNACVTLRSYSVCTSVSRFRLLNLCRSRPRLFEVDLIPFF